MCDRCSALHRCDWRSARMRRVVVRDSTNGRVGAPGNRGAVPVTTPLDAIPVQEHASQMSVAHAAALRTPRAWRSAMSLVRRSSLLLGGLLCGLMVGAVAASPRRAEAALVPGQIVLARDSGSWSMDASGANQVQLA